METQNKKEAVCMSCFYRWQTKSTKIYVNCPSCRNPVLINKKVKKDDKQN